MSERYRRLGTLAKVMVILQLCLVFAVMIWVLSGPFSAEYFTVQSSRVMHQAVVGDGTIDGKPARIARLFEQLPEAQQKRINASYQALQEREGKGFWTKSLEAVEDLLFRLPSFTQAWLFFSLCVCLMLLLHVEGTRLAAWVLPLVALAYGVNNYLTGGNRGHAFDADLFPSEHYIVENYLPEPLGPSIGEQHQQLVEAWHRYLVTEWLAELPEGFHDQIERGEHAFNVGRLERYIGASADTSGNTFFSKKPVGLLLAYVAWNLLFAVIVNRKD